MSWIVIRIAKYEDELYAILLQLLQSMSNQFSTNALLLVVGYNGQGCQNCDFGAAAGFITLLNMSLAVFVSSLLSNNCFVPPASASPEWVLKCCTKHFEHKVYQRTTNFADYKLLFFKECAKIENFDAISDFSSLLVI